MNKDNSDYETSEHIHTCHECHERFNCNDEVCTFLAIPFCIFCAIRIKHETEDHD